jgi:hypothetical protein
MDLQTPQTDDSNYDAVPLVGKERTCNVAGCTVRHYAKGFCKKHYTQLLRHGKLTPERERGVVRVCKVEGCGRTDTIRWYCRKHARQLRVHNRLTPDREHVMGFEGCRVPRCHQPHRAKGFCAKHYNRERWRRLKALREAKVHKAKKPRSAPPARARATAKRSARRR